MTALEQELYAALKVLYRRAERNEAYHDLLEIWVNYPNKPVMTPGVMAKAALGRYRRAAREERHDRARKTSI